MSIGIPLCCSFIRSLSTCFEVPREIARQRSEYFAKLANEQLEAVDNDLMKAEHKSMPINIDRQSRTTFGGRKR